MKMKLIVLFAIFPLLFCRGTISIKPSNAQFLKGPYIRHITSSSATIMWETALPMDSVLIYSENMEGWRSVKAHSYTETLINGIPANINSVEITGLAPDKNYYYSFYTVSSLKKPKEIYSFKTAPSPSGSFRFVAYGDNRGKSAGEQVNHKTIVEAITKIDPQPLLIVNSGDIVNSGTFITLPGSIGPNEWQLFFDTTQPLFNHIAYYPAVGNHDFSGVGEDQFKVFTAYFPFKGNKDTYYSFDIGMIHFIILNSETYFKTGSSQHTWLENDLKTIKGSQIKFIIAAFHSPPYSSSNHGSDMDIRESFSPLFEQYKVDLVLNGHDHIYERTCPIVNEACDNANGVTYIVAGAGGAPLYSCDSNPLPGLIQYCINEYVFTILDVSCDPECSIKGKTLKPDLTEVDSFTVTSRR